MHYLILLTCIAVCTICDFPLQANGLDERLNQTLQNMLVKFVRDKLKHWDEFLDTCTFTYNTSVHESALFSPFEIMFSHKATLPIDLVMAKQDEASEEKLQKCLQKCLETGGELSASQVKRGWQVTGKVSLKKPR